MRRDRKEKEREGGKEMRENERKGEEKKEIKSRGEKKGR